MATTSVNIRMDETVKKDAEKLFGEIGMSMSTAINVFVKQAVRQKKIPFEISAATTQNGVAVRQPFPFGSMKGEIWMSDDFDAPLEDFEEYMS